MKVLIACEFSQVVCKAFRDKGHEAYSCDILPTEGNPAWHIQDDVLKHLDGLNCPLCGGTSYSGYNLASCPQCGGMGFIPWDLMIAHPPCTYLANSGARWLFEKDGRWEKLKDGADFFNKLLHAPIPRICVENPQPHKWATELIGKYSQKIQPWWFGEGEVKGTCLWLKNLPPLMATLVHSGRKPRVHHEPPGPNQAKNRSRTYLGIAHAMAEQWGNLG